MPDAAEDLFDDETIAATEAAVDDAIRRAGGPREAVRALLVALAERDAAASLGYRRGRQPARKPA